MKHLWFGISLILSAGTANANTLHNISVRAVCGADQNVIAETLSPTALSADVTASAPSGNSVGCGAQASASVRNGMVRVRSSVANPGPGNVEVRDIIRGSAGAGAWIRYTGILAAPIQQANDVIDFSVNLSSSGSVSARSTRLISDSGAFLNSAQTISSSLRLFGSVGADGRAESFEERISVRVAPGDSDSEFLSGDFTTPSVRARAGSMISLTFGFDGGAGGQLQGAAGRGVVAADRSLSFSTTGAVFNIPDGWSVLFGEPTIIGNRYYGPDGPPVIDPAPVPLPAAAWGLLLGMLSLAGLRSRRRASAI